MLYSISLLSAVWGTGWLVRWRSSTVRKTKAKAMAMSVVMILNCFVQLGFLEWMAYRMPNTIAAVTMLKMTARDFNMTMTVMEMAKSANGKTFKSLWLMYGRAVSRKAESKNNMMESKFLCPLMPVTE